LRGLLPILHPFFCRYGSLIKGENLCKSPLFYVMIRLFSLRGGIAVVWGEIREPGPVQNPFYTFAEMSIPVLLQRFDTGRTP